MVYGDALNAKARLIGRVCFFLLLSLYAVEHNYYANYFSGGMWLMGCWLGGFFGVEGLDKRICWGF